MEGLALRALARCPITNTYSRGEKGHPGMCIFDEKGTRECHLPEFWHWESLKGQISFAGRLGLFPSWSIFGVLRPNWCGQMPFQHCRLAGTWGSSTFVHIGIWVVSWSCYHRLSYLCVNLTCSLCIVYGRRGCNLFARSFAYMSEMGQKLLQLVVFARLW